MVSREHNDMETDKTKVQSEEQWITVKRSFHTVPKEILLKFLIIGDYGVGKTAIVRRYTEGKFSSTYKITIGADFAVKTLHWDSNTEINIQLWDIAGHERFGYMTRVYYKYAVAAAIVFDLSRHATFNSVIKWLNDLRDKVTLSDGSPIPVVLLANKCDILGATVSTDNIKKFCKECKIDAWYITSAKENVNIDDAVEFLVKRTISIRNNEARGDSIIVNDSGVSNNKGFNKHRPCCN